MSALFSLFSHKRPRLHWQISDVIDYEFFMATDKKLTKDNNDNKDKINIRDRKIYQRIVDQDGQRKKSGSVDTQKPNALDDRELLRLWVEDRRRQEVSEKEPEADPQITRSPGEIYEHTYLKVSLLLTIFAGVVGFAFMLELCRPEGSSPCNISSFFAKIIILQYSLFLILVILKVGRKGLATERAYVQRILYWVFGQIIKSASPGLRSAIQSIKSSPNLYGKLWYWPFVNLGTAAMLAFNLGAWFCLITVPHFTDLSFGWESSYFDADAANYIRVIEIVSTPWRWLGAENNPTDDQVRASQYFPNLPEPLRMPNAQNESRSRKAWIPFLQSSIAVYGVGVRALLALIAMCLERRELKHLRFNWGGANDVIHRMRNDNVSITGGKNDENVRQLTRPRQGFAARSPSLNVDVSDSEYVVLVWGLEANREDLLEQLHDRLNREALREWRIRKLDLSQDLFALKLNKAKEVVLAVNEKRPPTSDMRDFVSRMTNNGKRPPCIRVAACVKGTNQHRKVWIDELTAWGNPYIDSKIIEATI